MICWRNCQIGLNGKWLCLGWPRHAGEDYYSNTLCTNYTCIPWKKEEN